MTLVHDLWRRPDHDLLNALNISFLEHLDFDGANGAEAWGHLSSESQDGWRVMRSEHLLVHEQMAGVSLERTIEWAMLHPH